MRNFKIGQRVRVAIPSLSREVLFKGTIVEIHREAFNDPWIVGVHFDSPEVSQRWRCNEISSTQRGFLVFDPHYPEFTPDNIQLDVLKSSLIKE